MKTSTSRRRRAPLVTTIAATLVLLVATGGSAQAATAVGLGTADSFVVLAGTGVTNTGATTLSGDLGSYPNGSVTGAETITFTGDAVNYSDNPPTPNAKLDLETAFGAASQVADVTVSANLGGQTLTPGVYFQDVTMNLSGPEPLYLDAENNPDAVWIFRAGDDLIVGEGAQVVLLNGADVCNVFWQVGSSATLNSGADFMGTILARASITLGAGATVEGRVLALDGTVTMINNTITRPVCAAPDDNGGDDNGDDNGDTGGNGDTGTGGTTGDQVAIPPAGGVATGDGSTSGGVDGAAYLMLAIVTVVAAAVVAGWRRRSARDL